MQTFRKTTRSRVGHISVHHYSCVCSRKEAAGALGYRGNRGEERMGVWLLSLEATVAMAHQCDAEAARGTDHLMRTHGILEQELTCRHILHCANSGNKAEASNDTVQQWGGWMIDRCDSMSYTLMYRDTTTHSQRAWVLRILISLLMEGEDREASIFAFLLCDLTVVHLILLILGHLGHLQPDEHRLFKRILPLTHNTQTHRDSHTHTCISNTSSRPHNAQA